MFSYQNLNDVEFEALCKDIMEKKLSKTLRFFAKGRDGGIDLTDSTFHHDIIVQVKHYIGSRFSDLKRAMLNEVDKVKTLKPKQYYVCCGMKLTANNIKEIYEMFKNYMNSDANIITLIEIDEFLQNPDNIDIVNKHYKLWLYSSNILSRIYNGNIFIDCEVLLSDIENESKYFVQTEMYNKCLEYLEKNGLLMITGGPGVGKTITSKMLVLFYSSKGYKVRYTTNGDLSDIKKALTSDKESHEIILLDDCLGQHYFSMNSTQESEILTLIKFVNLYKNKKIILNSRITIFNKAKDRSQEFKIYFQEGKIKNHIINMEDITIIEKAKILYNHLMYKKIKSEYYENLIRNKNYIKIVEHKNYTPRIIEHVTIESNYLEVDPVNYIDYILENLSNPYHIWKNEFERRLQTIDRVLLYTIYSLTDTMVKNKILKKCFEERLSKMEYLDYTISNYDVVLTRLNQSIIKIVDNKGEKYIGVINPSVNDYIKTVYRDNLLELKEIRSSIKHFSQFKRCFEKDEIQNVYLELIFSNAVINIDFNSSEEKNYFIVSIICANSVKQDCYTNTIIDYLNESYGYSFDISSELLSHTSILRKLLSENLNSFYSITSFFNDEKNLTNLLSDLDLDDLLESISIISEFYEINKIDVLFFKNICEMCVENEIITYVDAIEVGIYCEEYDISKIISDNTTILYRDPGYEYYVDQDAIISDLKQRVIDDVTDEIMEKLAIIDELANIDVSNLVKYNLYFENMDSFIKNYLEPNYDEDDYYRGTRPSLADTSEIEAIFERC